MTTWQQIQYPRLTEPVGDPGNWVEHIAEVFFAQWNPLTSQPVEPASQQHLLGGVAFVGEPSDVTAAPAQVVGWEQPTQQQQPLAQAYTYQLPGVVKPLNPADFVAPEHLFRWGQPISQPVLPTEYRHQMEAVFVQIDPADFVGPVAQVIGWEQATQQYMLQPDDLRHTHPSMFVQIEPGDFVVIAPPSRDWHQPIGQPVLPLEYRHQLEAVFIPSWEQIISTPDLVDFSTWVQPIGQPVLPLEYRYQLQSVFVQIEPDDFVVPAAAFVRLRTIDSLGDGRTIDSLGDQRRVQRG